MALKRVAAVLATALLVVLGACDTPPEQPKWEELSLPHDSGQRLMLRDVTQCEGKWYVVGAFADTEGVTKPAGWVSSDGRKWSALAFVPRADSLYGQLAILYSAACREGRLAAIGAKRGGAHGNPRVSLWHMRSDEVMEQADTSFEMFGGPKAVSVVRMAAGDDGWLIAGNRISGAAVWSTPDAITFKITEETAPLSSDSTMDTVAMDALWHNGKWIVVGGGQPTGRIDRDPVAWTSAETSADQAATWKRTALPSSDAYEEAQRVAQVQGEVVAIGLDGQTFRAWRNSGEQWRAAGRFGTTTGNRPPSVISLVSAGSALYATVANNTEHSLWASIDHGDSWRKVAVPSPLAAANDRTMVIGGSDANVILIEDDSQNSRIWVTKVLSW